jgi:DNA-binding response OmpR family regulator
MEDPLSDGKENVAAIFMVSTDETATVPLRGSLEKNGYRVCLFPDATQLKAILSQEKPGLLIYDCQPGDTEGYDLIREIKGDENLRAIPTLVLTRASTIEDLLRIIESNTDNFIAPPYDLPDRLSLIDNMLANPIGGHEREGKGKQFTVRHDEYTYTIAATNRKLLEYLLSSFEILAGRSSELSTAELKLGEVSGSVRELEARVTSQARDIESLNADIRQKEQRIIELTGDNDGLNATISHRAAEIQKLMAECDSNTKRLEHAGHALDEEKIRSESLGKQLADSTSGLEQQKSELFAERTRFLAAEQEISLLKQENTRSENEFNEIINGLRETATARESGITRLKDAIGAQTNLAESAEKEILALRQDKIRSENELNEIINGLRETATAQESEIARLKDTVGAQTELAGSAEKEIFALKQENTRSENELNEIINRLRETATAQESEIARLKGEMGTETDRRISAEDQVGSLRQEIGQHRDISRSEAEALGREVAGLQETLGEATAALETERELRRISEEKTGALLLQQEELEKKAGNAGKELEQARESAANSLLLKEALGTATARIQSLEEDVRRLVAEKTIAEREVQKVTAEREHQKTLSAVERSGIQGPDGGPADAGKERHLVQQPLFCSGDPPALPENAALIISETPRLPMIIPRGSPDEFSVSDKPMESAGVQSSANQESEAPTNPAGIGKDLRFAGEFEEVADEPGRMSPAGDIPFTSNQWLDLLKWARHSEALSEDQRLRIIRMGRLIQKDRKLTKNQQQQVSEILSLVNALGFQAQ